MSRTHHDEPHTATDTLKEKAREVQENLRDLGNTARVAANDTYAHVKEKAHDFVEHGKEKAHDFVEHERERVRHWEHSLEAAVKREPLKAVLIAAGAGIVLGLLWRRH